eukprot:gene4650-8597_t
MSGQMEEESWLLLEYQCAGAYRNWKGMSYFDIDDILMLEEKVNCVTSIDIIKLGELDSSSDTPYLKKGSKIDLPLWLIKNYREKTEEDVFEVNPPKFLSASYNEVLQADSTVINLQSWSTYFFSFALTYLSLFPDQSMAEVILKAFSERYRIVLDISQNAVQDDTSEKTRHLDQTEKGLFMAGLKDDRNFQLWWRRKAHIIQPWQNLHRLLSREDVGHLSKRPRIY